MRGEGVRFRLLRRAAQGLGLAVLLFMLVPVLATIPLSFTAGTDMVYPLDGTSLRWYRDFFTRPEWLASLQNSLAVGAGSAALATVLGTMAALGLRQAPTAVRNGLAALLILPLAIPTVIVAVASFFFYSSVGLAGTYPGLVLAHTTLALPFVVISVRASLESQRGDFANAASSLGAPPWRVFLRVTGPMIAPGIATGALFAFATSLDDVIVAMFVGGPSWLTLPRQMFNGLRENISPTILAAAAMLTGVSVVLMAATGWLGRPPKRG